MPSLKKNPPVPATFVSLDKQSKPVSLSKSNDGWYTLICVFDRKDYDLMVEVVYTDDYREWIAVSGAQGASASLRSMRGDIIHLGDRATTNRGGPQAFEVVQMRLGANVVAIVPVVYSAQNSGFGSFRLYGVSTYVLAGKHTELPSDLSKASGIIVEAKNASWNPFRFSFVPCVIRNGTDGGTLDPSQQQYSKMFSENRPRYSIPAGKVLMDHGPCNYDKCRPRA